MVRVLVCDEMGGEGVALLREAGLKVDVKPTITREELKAAVKDYEAVVVRSRTKITEEIINAAPKLKMIARVGVGLDNIALKAAEAMGVKVLHAPEAVSDSTAEHTLTLILAQARKIPAADASMKRGEWAKTGLMGRQLKGKTLGVVGFGRVGSRVGRVARALGMRVLAYDVVLNEALLREVGAEAVALEELLRSSDVVTLHVTLTPETRHLIGRRELGLMKRGAVLVNAARGGLIDEGALLDALKNGQLGGAALDVYEEEPPTRQELQKLPNIVSTPHIGAQTEEAQREAGLVVARKIIEEAKTLAPSEESANARIRR